MTELNCSESFEISNTTAFTFTIEDTSNYKDYLREGIVAQIKVPVIKHHENFGKRLIEPVGNEEYSMIMSDFGKFGRSEHLH